MKFYAKKHDKKTGITRIHLRLGEDHFKLNLYDESFKYQPWKNREILAEVQKASGEWFDGSWGSFGKELYLMEKDKAEIEAMELEKITGKAPKKTGKKL